MPSAPTCAALSTRVITKTGATTWPLFLAAIVDAANDTTDDAEQTIPAASIHVATSKFDVATGLIREAIYLEPAATSPAAGKYIIVIAAPTSSVGSAVCHVDTMALNKCFIGIYMANAGATVSVASHGGGAWNASATPFSGGTGHWSKFFEVTATGTMSQLVYNVTNEALSFDVQEVGGGLFRGWAGLGIRGCSDSANDGESGLGGAVFYVGCSGSTAALQTNMWAVAASSGGTMLTNSASAARSHMYYRPPGAASIVACGWSDGTTPSSSGAFVAADDDFMLSQDGVVEPENIMIRRTDTNRKIGRCRMFFSGPRRINKAILSDGATKKWIVAGSSSSGAGDALLMPI